jgi:DNA-binding transcriptional regulator LsrR (DeoR family)
MGRKPKLADPDLHAIAAAYLSSQGQSQADIAKSLLISQSAVSRLMKTEIAKRCLTTPDPVFTCPKDDQVLWEKAQSKFFPATELLDSLKPTCREGPSLLRQVRIIYGTTEDSFGPAVVPAVQEVIAGARIVGVTWGRTISGLLRTLQAHLAAPIKPEPPLTIFPLCGEPLKHRSDPLRFSSSNLAAQLDELINGQRNEVTPSLAGVPTFIPRQNFTKKETDTIRRFIRLGAGYSQVFGDGDNRGGGKSQALVERADTILTSVGVVEGSRRGIFMKERVELGDLTDDQLVNWVVGDIGGVMIPRRGLVEAQEKAVDEMNSRWTGFSHDHLKKCAARAVQHDEKPGVVVFAAGPQRVDMVLRIVEENLVSQLIVDRALGAELLARIASKSVD